MDAYLSQARYTDPCQDRVSMEKNQAISEQRSFHKDSNLGLVQTHLAVVVGLKRQPKESRI